MKRRAIAVCLYFLIMTVMISCSTRPSAYTPDTAKKNGDVVDVHGKITNMTRFEAFYANINSNKKDRIRVTRYTIEGDAILYDIEFNGKTIKCSVDNTRDAFSAEADRKVKKYEYSKLVKETKENTVEYNLYDNKGEKTNILVISK